LLDSLLQEKLYKESFDQSNVTRERVDHHAKN